MCTRPPSSVQPVADTCWVTHSHDGAARHGSGSSIHFMRCSGRPFGPRAWPLNRSSQYSLALHSLAPHCTGPVAASAGCAEGPSASLSAGAGSSGGGVGSSLLVRVGDEQATTASAMATRAVQTEVFISSASATGGVGDLANDPEFGALLCQGFDLYIAGCGAAHVDDLEPGQRQQRRQVVNRRASQGYHGELSAA